MNTTVERFLRYVRIETTSSETSGVRPSTPGQMNLIRLLAEEMQAMGMTEVKICPLDGAVFGTIPANTEEELPVLGFLAHVDTSDAASGKDVKPQFVYGYQGQTLDLGHGVSMSPETSPCLKEVIGEDLIVTDGATLLGADDKAGVAEIMSMAELLLTQDRSPGMHQKHGKIRVAFTTDEEIGSGTDLFDIREFGCDYAYTVDGGPLGQLEYENFNAASATITFHGVGIHPGSAKNVMKNACSIAAEFHWMLPAEQAPEHTENYEGFLHLRAMQGDVTGATLSYILRDHDLELLRKKEALLQSAAAYVNLLYGAGTAEVAIEESYYNMKEKILPHMHLIETARKAFAAAGVRAQDIPIRGGTDGARLSYQGLPCPNLSTGGYQFHGVREFITVRALETMPEVLSIIAYEYGKGVIKNVSAEN